MIEKAQLIITQKTCWKHRCFTLPADLELQHKYKHLAHINTLIHQILLAVKHKHTLTHRRAARSWDRALDLRCSEVSCTVRLDLSLASSSLSLQVFFSEAALSSISLRHMFNCSCRACFCLLTYTNHTHVHGSIYLNVHIYQVFADSRSTSGLWKSTSDISNHLVICPNTWDSRLCQ